MFTGKRTNPILYRGLELTSAQMYDEKAGQKLLLSIELFTTTASNSDPTYGQPIPVLKDATIMKMLDKLGSLPKPVKSQPSSPAPPQSSSPSQLGTQVIATQAVGPAKHNHQLKVGVKVQHPTTNAILGFLGQKKPDIRPDPDLKKLAPIEKISKAQVPTVLSKVSDIEVSQLSSKLGAKANSKPSVNAEKVETITAGDKIPLVNSSSNESEKENSQESLGRTQVPTPIIAANNSHCAARPEEKKPSSNNMDRFGANPFEERTTIPRKWVGIPENQSSLLERKEAWYEPLSTSTPLAVIPAKTREEFLAHLSSRGHPQERTASSDSESSDSEGDDESGNENEVVLKPPRQETHFAKVEEKLETRVSNAALTVEGIASGESKFPSPENADKEGSKSPERTPSEEGVDSDWASSPAAHLKETVASLARKQQEATPVPELPKLPSPRVTQSAAIVNRSTSRETTPVLQPSLLNKENVTGRSTREATSVMELLNPSPAVHQSTRRYFPIPFPCSSGIEPELELDELHAEGDSVEGDSVEDDAVGGSAIEGENIKEKEIDNHIAQVADVSQETSQEEISSTALQRSREVQVKKSPFVNTSKSPQKKLASSSDRRIPATFQPDSSKPEEYKDAMSSISKPSTPELRPLPAPPITQNDSGHNLNSPDDSDAEEYASAEDYNQTASSTFQNQLIASSPLIRPSPVLSPSTPNKGQPAGSIMNESPSRESMQWSPYTQVACTMPSPGRVPKSSKPTTGRSNLHDLSIPSSPPFIPQDNLSTLDGASDHSPTNTTPTKRRLALAATIRREISTRKNTKEMARAERHEFMSKHGAETPDISPQTRPRPHDKLGSESNRAPVDEPPTKDNKEISPHASSAHEQVFARKHHPATAIQDTPETGNKLDSNPEPAKVLERDKNDEAYEAENDTADSTWSSSPPRMPSPLSKSTKLAVNPQKKIAQEEEEEKERVNILQANNSFLPKPFFKSSNGTSGSETPEKLHTSHYLAAENDGLATLDYHQRFKAAYPEYSGSRRDFTWALVYVKWLRDKKYSLLKSLVDEFIAMMTSGYVPYVREIKSSRKDIMNGWDFFEENFDRSSHTKGIIIPDNLHSALESLDQSLITEFRKMFDADVNTSQTQSPGATPSTANKPVPPAPGSVTRAAEADCSNPSVTATKGKVSRSLPWQCIAQQATATPTHKPLAKVRKDNPSSLVLETGELQLVDYAVPDLDLGTKSRPKRKFDSSALVHDEGTRGSAAKRPSYRTATTKHDVSVTPTFKKSQVESRNSSSPHPSLKPVSLPISANSSRLAKSPHLTGEDRTRTPVFHRRSLSQQPSAFKTPSVAKPLRYINSPHSMVNDEVNVQNTQPRSSSLPHPTTFKSPSLSALASSSRLPKSPHAVMDEKTKVENWNVLPHDEDDNPQSIAPYNEDLNKLQGRFIQQSMKLKSMADSKKVANDHRDASENEDLNELRRRSIQRSAKRKFMTDDKVTNNFDDKLPSSVSKSLRVWNEHSRKSSPDRSGKRKSMNYPGQDKTTPSETLQSNGPKPSGKIKLKPTPSPSIIQPSSKHHSVDIPRHDKIIPNHTPRQDHASRPTSSHQNSQGQPKAGDKHWKNKTNALSEHKGTRISPQVKPSHAQDKLSSTAKPHKEVNMLKRKSPPDSDSVGVPRSAKREPMSFEAFLPNSEFLRMRRESRGLDASSRNSTPVGKGVEVRSEGEREKGKKIREPETQGWS